MPTKGSGVFVVKRFAFGSSKAVQVGCSSFSTRGSELSSFEAKTAYQKNMCTLKSTSCPLGKRIPIVYGVCVQNNRSKAIFINYCSNPMLKPGFGSEAFRQRPSLDKDTSDHHARTYGEENCSRSMG